MLNYRPKQKRTSCDVCRWKMLCKDDGIVETRDGKAEWIGVHFWICSGKTCPIDDKVESTRLI